MRFDIDYSHAKTMATRLQTYLAGSPKKLSRSSSIEAIAQVLGFNNRNEMAARLTEELTASETEQAILAYEKVIGEVATWRNNTPMTGEECYNTIRMRLSDLGHSPQEAPQSAATSERRKSRDVALDALNELRLQELDETAQALVAKARRHAKDVDFQTAIHTEINGAYVLAEVEDRILQSLLADPQRRSLLCGIFCESEEFESARLEGLDNLSEALARTLINESLPRAEALWDESQD